MPIDAQTLRRFSHHKTFVETGCGSGDGIQAALDAGFVEVFSIELYKIKYLPVKKRFLHDERVSLILGHSADILTGLLPALPSSVVFWLDAHYDFAVRGKGNNLADIQPILHELDAIKNYSKSNEHVILIDDRMDFVHPKSWFHDISEQDLKNKILKINPKYGFSTLDGADKDTVLLAEVFHE